jgi:uncharacterized protein YoxC
MLTGNWTKSVLAQEIQSFEQKLTRAEKGIAELMSQLQGHLSSLEEKKKANNEEDAYEIEELEGEILFVKSEVQNQKKQTDLLLQNINKLKAIQI